MQLTYYWTNLSQNDDAQSLLIGQQIITLQLDVEMNTVFSHLSMHFEPESLVRTLQISIELEEMSGF